MKVLLTYEIEVRDESEDDEGAVNLATAKLFLGTPRPQPVGIRIIRDENPPERESFSISPCHMPA